MFEFVLFLMLFFFCFLIHLFTVSVRSIFCALGVVVCSVNKAFLFSLILNLLFHLFFYFFTRSSEMMVFIFIFVCDTTAFSSPCS